jgi:D-alanyl-D-alanine carboxypeptidase
MLHNTNRLIGHFEGADGIKTGFTLKAGFNLTATALRGNMRLIAVVLGAPSNTQRFVQAAKLLDWGFDNFERVEVIKQGQLLPMQVRVGANEVMQPVARSTVAVIVPKKDASELKMDLAVPTSLYGPLAPDQTVGQVIVRDHSEVVATFDAVSPSAVGQQPFPIGQSPAVVAATAPVIQSNAQSNGVVTDVTNVRGATIRVVPSAAAAPINAAAGTMNPVAAPVNPAMAPMNAAVAPLNQTAIPVR